MTFVFLFAALVVALVVALVHLQVSSWSLSRCSWEELVSRIQPVRREGITQVALEYLNPIKSQLGMEPNEIWERVGGAEGLAAMRANAEILIALAAYAQRWNFHESAIVAERMRHDGLALRRATARATPRLFFSYNTVRVPFYVHEAASSYYLMRARLLALYETSHVARYPTLAAAL